MLISHSLISEFLRHFFLCDTDWTQIVFTMLARCGALVELLLFGCFLCLFHLLKDHTSSIIESHIAGVEVLFISSKIDILGHLIACSRVMI